MRDFRTCPLYITEVARYEMEISFSSLWYMLSLGFLSNISPKASKVIAENLEGMQIDCVACCFLQAQYVKPSTAFQFHMFIYMGRHCKSN